VAPHLPLTSDGRHCDFAPSVSLAVWLLSGSNFAADLAAAMREIAKAGGAEAFFEEDEEDEAAE
jgi:hypothetical protein